MKKILTLLLLMITVTTFANRVLWRSTTDPYVATATPHTSIWVKPMTVTDPNAVLISGTYYNGSISPTAPFLDLSSYFSQGSITYGNRQYVVIGGTIVTNGTTGGLLRLYGAAGTTRLFQNIWVSSEYAIYRDGTNFYYWFDYVDSIPAGSPNTPVIDANGTLASDQFSFSTFSVYPNPTSSMLNIDSDKEFSASLYDLTGKKLLNFSTKTFDISQLASGIYYLDIILEDKRYTKKIIKQ